MILLAWANLLLAFLLELAALWILGYWGFHLGLPETGRWAFGLGAPVLFLAAWTIWAAPKSRRRLQGPRLWLYKVVVYTVAALALAATGQARNAAVFEVVVLANLALLWIWKRFEPA